MCVGLTPPLLLCSVRSDLAHIRNSLDTPVYTVCICINNHIDEGPRTPPIEELGELLRTTEDH